MTGIPKSLLELVSSQLIPARTVKILFIIQGALPVQTANAEPLHIKRVIDRFK